MIRESLGPYKDLDSVVNPHRYTISFGAKRAALTGVEPRRGPDVRENIITGAPPMDDPAESQEVHRFAQVAHLVVAATNP